MLAFQLRKWPYISLRTWKIRPYRVMPTFSVYRYLVVMMLGVGDCDGDVRWLKGGGGNACIVSIVVHWLCLRFSAGAGLTR